MPFLFFTVEITFLPWNEVEKGINGVAKSGPPLSSSVKPCTKSGQTGLILLSFSCCLDPWLARKQNASSESGHILPLCVPPTVVGNGGIFLGDAHCVAYAPWFCKRTASSYRTGNTCSSLRASPRPCEKRDSMRRGIRPSDRHWQLQPCPPLPTDFPCSFPWALSLPLAHWSSGLLCPWYSYGQGLEEWDQGRLVQPCWG